MKSLINARFLAAAALTLGALGAASAAHARSDVYLSIGLQGTPGVYMQPAPVYVQPAPVYAQPRHGYVAPAAVYDRGYDRGYSGQPRYEDRGYYGQHRYDDRGYYSQHRYDDRGRGHARRFGPWGDLDRDGIRNRDDRDMDGDGVRNRRDREPNNPYRY